MANPYTTWTVNPHGAVDKLADNLWHVSGTFDNGKIQRRMVLVRLADGRVLLHNPIALEDDLLAELESWGEVAGLIVPNSFHRMDARIMKDRFPQAKVYCPAGAAKAVGTIVPVDGTLADVPGDSSVRTRHLDGIGEKEGVMEIRSGDSLTAVFCDAVMNQKALSGVMGFMLAPTGQMSVPRVLRWFFVKDKKALRADLERIADTDGLTRLIPGHGSMAAAPAAPLREAATLLG